jgi:hypothetical protein
MHYEITDDTGAIAFVDPDAYESFIAEEWTVEQLDEKFKAQMSQKHLLIWETGMENIWRVQVDFAKTHVRGFRDATGPIVATQGRLLLTSYDSLAMAAQYNDVRLPEPHELDQVISVPPGEYHCRIIQMYDFDPLWREPHQELDVDFVIEIIAGNDLAPVWREPPWASHVLKQWIDPNLGSH